MNPSLKKIIPYLLLILFALVYFNFLAGYILFYQEKANLFVCTGDYFSTYLNQPGRIIVYAGYFLSAFYYYPFIGSVIIISITVLTIFLISEILKKPGGYPSFIIPFLAGIILLYLHTSHQYFIYNSLAIFLQVLLFYLTSRYLSSHLSWIPVLIIPLWYFITGCFAFIFILMLTWQIILNPERKRWIKLLFFWLLILLSLFISKEYLFFQPLEKLLIYPFSVTNTGKQTGLFFILILIISLLPLIARLKPLTENRLRRFVPAIQLIIPVLLISLSASYSISRINNNTKQYFNIEKLFYRQNFDELISSSISNPTNNQLTSYLTNIALCEEGKLADLLFNVPQSLENNTLFLKWERVGEILKRGGQVYYTLGMVNEAHRWSFEYMVMEGYTPEGIKMLIKTELINRNYATAEKYIRLLKNSLFYRKEALHYSRLLYDDGAVDADPELGQKRKIRLKQDFFIVTQDPLINLENVLAADTLNRRAFEYKIAYLLLKKDFMNVVNEIPYLERYGYKVMPVHMQEAAAVYRALPGNESESFGKYGINDDTANRFVAFYKLFQQSGNDRKAAEKALKEKFGNTFWFHVLYN